MKNKMLVSLCLLGAVLILSMPTISAHSIPLAFGLYGSDYAEARGTATIEQDHIKIEYSLPKYTPDCYGQFSGQLEGTRLFNHYYYLYDAHGNPACLMFTQYGNMYRGHWRYQTPCGLYGGWFFGREETYIHSSPTE